jgi:small subunit ribosomal protein S6
MFIVRPDVVEEEVDKLIAGFSTNVANGGGVVKTVEKMGRRKLAYMVRKFNDGNYVLLTVEANGPVVLELERRLRVTEPVIKFITVRIDEEEKRLAKVKALRGVRRKLSAEPAAPFVPACRRRFGPRGCRSCRARNRLRLVTNCRRRAIGPGPIQSPACAPRRPPGPKRVKRKHHV